MSSRKVVAALLFVLLCTVLVSAQRRGIGSGAPRTGTPPSDPGGSAEWGRVTGNSSTGNAPADGDAGNTPTPGVQPTQSGRGPTITYSQFQIPPKARSHYEKAAKLMAEGKLEKARKKVDEALAIYPKFAEALTLRGMLKFVAAEQTEAVADLQQAIAYDANYALAYIGLGSALNSMGRFSESVPVLTQAERLAPTTWQTYFELARANLGKREFATALHNVNHAAQLHGGPQKESPELHLVRGYALVGLNQTPQAVAELQTFLAHQPAGRIADGARVVLDQLQQPGVSASK